MDRYAHSLRGAPRTQWHLLAEHLDETGERAARIAAKWGAEPWGRAAGRLHDVGKVAVEFEERLRGGGIIDHATAGAQVATQRYGHMGRLLAYVVAGHHGGMPDGTGHDETTLDRRLKKTVPDYSAWPAEVVLPPELPNPLLLPHPTEQAKRLGFSLHVWARMLFSALCDADFLDTEAFYARALRRDVGRGSSHSLSQIARRLDAHLQQFRDASGSVNAIRAEVLEVVRGQATARPGLFTLTVPTGGGKTLASLAWGLGHGRAWGKDRIIYVIPFTSIIDQTAAVFRDALGPQLADAVLEHHSGYRERANLEAEAKLARAAENWDAPIVLTTAVQFFESLFSNRPSRCRKLHNIANSVVILDEAQTLPPQLLRPCVAMLDELARNYGASILLCTATQPAVTEREGDLRSLKGGLVAAEVRELMGPPNNLRLHERLRRVTVTHGGAMSDTDLVAALAASEHGLVIVNTRRHARDLYRAAASLEGAAHLSALMYPAHRVGRLKEVTDALKARPSRPVRLISTTVLEAGVDVDFARVWRAMAGLDSIAQAAGRCNREGRRALEESIVTVFDPADPSTTVAPHVVAAANAAREVFRRHGADPLSPSAIRDYFRSYYGRRDRIPGGLDTADILDQLAGAHQQLAFPFATIAETVSLIDEAGAPVIVPRDEGRDVVEALARATNDTDPREMRRLYRRAQNFTVQVPRKAIAALLASGSVVPIIEGDDPPMMLADLSLYRDDVGLDVI